MARRKKAKRKKNPVHMGGYNKAYSQLHAEIKTMVRFVEELVEELEQEEREPDTVSLLGRLSRVKKKLVAAEEIFEE